MQSEPMFLMSATIRETAGLEPVGILKLRTDQGPVEVALNDDDGEEIIVILRSFLQSHSLRSCQPLEKGPAILRGEGSSCM